MNESSVTPVIVIRGVKVAMLRLLGDLFLQQAHGRVGTSDHCKIILIRTETWLHRNEWCSTPPDDMAGRPRVPADCCPTPPTMLPLLTTSSRKLDSLVQLLKLHYSVCVIPKDAMLAIHLIPSSDLYLAIWKLHHRIRIVVDILESRSHYFVMECLTKKLHPR